MTVDVEGLVVTYRSWVGRRVKALDGLDLQVQEGDFFALLGQNGAGKSTAIHTILGLLRPTRGCVRVLGDVPRPGHPNWRHLSYLPEEPLYHGYLTVEEALAYYSTLAGRAASRQATTELLERLNLAEHRRARISSCSKGMKQKVGIAACLLHDPTLIVLDEPMRGLDPAAVHTFRDLLLERNRRGATILMSSHLLSEVELVATRVGIMDRGRLLVADDVNRLKSTDDARYVVRWRGTADVWPRCEEVSTIAGEVQATIPAGALFEWTDYARAHGLQVVSCTLRQTSLEQTYLSVIGLGRHDA